MNENNNFLAQAVRELNIYYTPKAIIDYINLVTIIKNPPYDVRKNIK